MSHKSGHIIIERVGAAVKSTMTGDNKWVSLVVAVAGAALGGWMF
jgi:hypothetical protein